jgi:hypothetical protein
LIHPNQFRQCQFRQCQFHSKLGQEWMAMKLLMAMMNRLH